MPDPETLARKCAEEILAISFVQQYPEKVAEKIAAAVQEALEEAEKRLGRIVFLQHHPTVFDAVIAALKGAACDE